MNTSTTWRAAGRSLIPISFAFLIFSIFQFFHFFPFFLDFAFCKCTMSKRATVTNVNEVWLAGVLQKIEERCHLCISADEARGVSKQTWAELWREIAERGLWPKIDFVSLIGCKLKSLPTSFGSAKVSGLHLRGNFFDDATLAMALANCPNLEQLDASDNRLYRMPDFTKNAVLTEVELDYNFICAMEFDRLNNVERLSMTLQNEQLTSWAPLHPDTYEEMPASSFPANLKELDVEHNKLPVINSWLVALLEQSNVEWLNVACNESGNDGEDEREWPARIGDLVHDDEGEYRRVRCSK